MKDKTIRICYIANGKSLHTQRWVNYFAGKGHEVHLISSRFTEGYDGYHKGITMHPLGRLFTRLPKISGYISGILWLFQIRRLVREIKPEVLDAHFITINGYLGAFSRFHPLIVTAWGGDVLTIPKNNPIHKYLTTYTLKKADIVVCDSNTVKRELLGFGVKSDKIRIIFNGIDTQQFNPEKKNEELKHKLGIPGAPVIVSIRNLFALYNVEMLIRAIPLVLSKVPEAEFLIGGDGEQRNYLESLVNSLGVEGNSKFIGNISHHDIPEYLASSDIYVSTSLSDSTSLSLQEAMACELAPVVTDLPANREWINDGENGFIVPIGDTETLAQKIVDLIRNEELRRKFGKLGRKIIKEKAEYEREMGKIEKIYQDLAGV